MHDGVVPIVFDELGRCAYCVKNGQWTPDAPRPPLSRTGYDAG
jgi:hypothetical protein